MPSAGSGNIRLGAITAVTPGGRQPGGSPPQAGQIYRARVERVDTDGSCLLRLGDQTLRLAAGMDLVAGQELLLRMTSTVGGPRFTVMRSLPAPRDERRGAATPDNLVSALQVMAGRQQSLGGLLAWLADPGSEAAETALARLHNSLNTPGELVQPDRLRCAMHDSGLLLEPRLAAATAEPALFPEAVRGDFKLLLWRLIGLEAGALGDGLGELLEDLLAHISLRQLRAIRQAENGHFYWSLELPLVWDGRLLPVDITLRRERGLLSPENPDSQSWEIEISLEAEPLGMLTMHLFLRDRQISVSLEAERAATVAALRRDLSSLGEALSLQGFSVETLVSRPIDRAAGGSAAETFREISSLGDEL